MKKEEALRAIPLFAGLGAGQVARLSEASMERPAAKGEMLFLERGEAKGFYVVLTGRVKIYRSSPDGRETVLHLYGPGNIFGEVPVFAGGRFPANAMAVEDGRVLFLPREKLVAMLKEDAGLAMNMLASMSMKLREFASRVEALTVQDIPARLAAYLLDQAERDGQEGQPATSIRLDITKGLLAGILGATREALSRSLSKMAEQGLILVRGREIDVLDAAGLRELASGLSRL